MSRAALIDAYISGLNLTAVTVVGAGRRCRITDGEPAPGETIQRRYFFKPSHVDWLLMTIGQEGLSGKPAAALADAIVQAAARLGAPFQTPAEIRKAAEIQVVEIVARVRASGQAGGLKKWNRSYKAYRQAQVAKAEPAIRYSAFIDRFVMTAMVRDVAASGRMV